MEIYEFMQPNLEADHDAVLMVMRRVKQTYYTETARLRRECTKENRKLRAAIDAELACLHDEILEGEKKHVTETTRLHRDMGEEREKWMGEEKQKHNAEKTQLLDQIAQEREKRFREVAEERDKHIREYSDLQQQHVNDIAMKSESHVQVRSQCLLEVAGSLLLTLGSNRTLPGSTLNMPEECAQGRFCGKGALDAREKHCHRLEMERFITAINMEKDQSTAAILAEKERHNVAIVAGKERSAAAIIAVKECSVTAIVAGKEHSAAALQMLTKKHNEAVQALVKQHKETSQALVKKHDEANQALVKQHNEASALVTSAHSAEIEAEKERSAAALKKLMEKHEDNVATMINSHNAELAGEKERLATTLQAELRHLLPAIIGERQRATVKQTSIVETARTTIQTMSTQLVTANLTSETMSTDLATARSTINADKARCRPCPRVSPTSTTSSRSRPQISLPPSPPSTRTKLQSRPCVTGRLRYLGLGSDVGDEGLFGT